MRWLRFAGGLAVVAAWYILLYPVAEAAWRHFLRQPWPWSADLGRFAVWVFFCIREFPGYRLVAGKPSGITTGKVVPETPTAPLVGWRAWRIGEVMEWTDGDWVGRPRLMSLMIPDSWPESGPKQARCFSAKRHGDRTPGPDCNCGLYAVADWQHAQLISRIGRRQVYGLALTWGRTQVHERGWRSEFAQPLALVRPRILRPKLRREMNLVLDRLGAEYAVPVLSLKDAKALASRMAEGAGHP